MKLNLKAAIIFSVMVLFTGSTWAENGHGQNELDLIKENTVNLEHGEQSPLKEDLAKFLVYTGSSGEIVGLKFYEFDQEMRSHQKSVDFCATKGLRLMSSEEAKDLEKELGSDKSKLEKWLGGKKHTWVWTSSVDPFYPDIPKTPGDARYIYADGYGSVGMAHFYHRHITVRCVPLSRESSARP